MGFVFRSPLVTMSQPVFRSYWQTLQAFPISVKIQFVTSNDSYECKQAQRECSQRTKAMLFIFSVACGELSQQHASAKRQLRRFIWVNCCDLAANDIPQLLWNANLLHWSFADRISNELFVWINSEIITIYSRLRLHIIATLRDAKPQRK